ncbi:MAG: DUF6164 family protein [Sulfuricella sp.]|nr:DUF6164 family protein [Gammaproteobacteria bacterium]
MPTKLFALRGVPDDEAGEIRELLADNGIDYHETPAGNWGISAPAIWVNDENQAQKAKSLLEKYQQERLARARTEYERLKKAGKNKTVIDLIKEDPVRFIAYLAIIALVVYLSTKPFLHIGK